MVWVVLYNVEQDAVHVESASDYDAKPPSGWRVVGLYHENIARIVAEALQTVRGYKEAS